MKGCKLSGETHSKIEKHIAKHRAYGGRTDTVKGHGKESATEGRDEAALDLKDTPADRLKKSKPSEMAEEKSDKGEEHSHGGKVKKRRDGGEVKGDPVAGKWPKHRRDGGKVPGENEHHHAGRRARARGGYAEDSPFTTANKSTPAPGRGVMKMSEGLD